MNITHLDNAVVVRGHFGKEELEAFVANQKTKQLVKSGIYNSKFQGVDGSVRNSMQVRINKTNPVVNKLRECVETVNAEHLRINLSRVCDENDFVEYNVNGKFEKHNDILWPSSALNHDKNPVRKTTTVVLLNDDFTGGKLALWSKGNRYSFEFNPGDVITFPSYVQHMVDPVESGVRYSLVSWSYGEF
ncbi:MAG: 2OG-Fe(II) oxygenase [Bacteroidetes bacterium]|nr:2OG-Fe(II) oxygenase [bacterium]NBP64488.1 2OG-Fe(II) oxygenase [Bacteroidota bacterium]